MAVLSDYIEGGSGGGTATTGKPVQIVTGYYLNNSAHNSTTSTSMQSTGLSATITPRSYSNSILIEFYMNMGRSDASGGMGTGIYRSGAGLSSSYIVNKTQSYSTDYYHGLMYTSGANWAGRKNTHVDSSISSATGAITYAIYFYSWHGYTVYFNHQGMQTYIKLTEIQA